MLKHFLQELRHTFRVLLWLYRDAVWRYRWSSALMVLLDLIALASAGVVIGVLKTAQSISEKQPVGLPFGLTSIDTSQPMNLVGLGVGFFVAGFLGAVAFWFTRRTSRRTAARYQHFSAMRALRLLQTDEPAYWMLKAEDKSPNGLLRFCADLAPQLLNRCFVWVMQSIRSTIWMIVSVAGMIYFNALLSLVLMPLAIVYLVILSRLSRKASDSDLAYRHSRDVYKQASREYCSNYAPETPSDQAFESQLTKARETNLEMTGQLAARRLMVARTQFLNLTLLALISAIIFIFFAVRISQGSADWSNLIFFVVCLRFFIAGLTNTTTLVVRLHLFAARLEEYEEVIDAGPDMPDHSTIELATIESLLGPRTPDDEAAQDAPIMLIVPWSPKEFDLSFGAAFLHRYGAIEDDARPCLLTKENRTDTFEGLDQEQARWIVCLYKGLNQIESIYARWQDESPSFSHRVLMLDSLERKPKEDERAESSLAPEVLVWSAGGIREHGDWAWYMKNWTTLYETYQPGPASFADDDDDLDDD